MKQIFARKPLELLLEEMKGENRLRRILGPVALTSLELVQSLEQEYLFLQVLLLMIKPDQQ